MPNPHVPNRAQTLLDASGAVVPGDGIFHITKAGVAALTLAKPEVDGLSMLFVSETAAAHTITVERDSPITYGLNGALVTATFGGAKGDHVELVSRAGSWWTVRTRNITLS